MAFTLITSNFTRGAAFGLATMCAGHVVRAAETQSNQELQETINKLQERNAALVKSLAEANQAEKKATEELSQIKLRLDALGKDLLVGGNERLVQAASDLEIANSRVTQLQQSSTKLINAVNEYLRQAVIADPQARMTVEVAMRELDSTLGLRQKPQANVRSGSLQAAKIVSIDQESGLLVLNVGEAEGARIGSSFLLKRANQTYGKAIVVDVRKGVSGAFVDQLDPQIEAARLGDSASIDTQPNR